MKFKSKLKAFRIRLYLFLSNVYRKKSCSAATKAKKFYCKAYHLKTQHNLESQYNKENINVKT